MSSEIFPIEDPNRGKDQLDSTDDIPWVQPADNDFHDSVFSKTEPYDSLPLALPPEDELPCVVAMPRPPHPGYWWSWLWCFVYLIATQVVPAFTVICVMIGIQIIKAGDVQTGLSETIGGDQGTEFSRRSLMPSLFAAQATGIVFSLLIIRLLVGREWKRKIAFCRPGFVHLALVLIGFPALPILASGIFALAKHFLPSFGDIFKLFVLIKGPEDLGMESLVKEIRTWPWQLAVLIIGVGPGINEELWCRGFLGRGLVGRYGVVGGIILTSFFFGLLHIDPQQGFMAACMGLALHFTYVMSRSLWVPMLLHFMNNSLSAIASHLGPEVEKIDTAGNEIPVMLYLGSAILMLAVGYALYVSRVRLVRAHADIVYPWRPDYPGVELPPAGSGTIVVRPWPGWLASGLVALGSALFMGSAYWTWSHSI
ncbi:MAG: CPBP family intramembrane glutamic endopeptidase [Gemmataceae bacterium]